MQSNAYWSGTTYALNTNFAWFFYNYPGMQSFGGKFGSLYAVAVRPGDLSARSAPEPGSLAMLLAGLGALAAARALREHRRFGRFDPLAFEGAAPPASV